jgi:hypothetical protein
MPPRQDVGTPALAVKAPEAVSRRARWPFQLPCHESGGGVEFVDSGMFANLRWWTLGYGYLLFLMVGVTVGLAALGRLGPSGARAMAAGIVVCAVAWALSVVLSFSRGRRLRILRNGDAEVSRFSPFAGRPVLAAQQGSWELSIRPACRRVRIGVLISRWIGWCVLWRCPSAAMVLATSESRESLRRLLVTWRLSDFAEESDSPLFVMTPDVLKELTVSLPGLGVVLDGLLARADSDAPVVEVKHSGDLILDGPLKGLRIQRRKSDA